MENGQEKLQGSDVNVTLSNPFLKWLDNFWYHHKWKVIIITFFAIVVIVGVVQMVNKEKYDVNVTVATHTTYYTENVDAIERALVSLMQTDMNGDGNPDDICFFFETETSFYFVHMKCNKQASTYEESRDQFFAWAKTVKLAPVAQGE